MKIVNEKVFNSRMAKIHALERFLDKEGIIIEAQGDTIVISIDDKEYQVYDTDSQCFNGVLPRTFETDKIVLKEQ